MKKLFALILTLFISTSSLKGAEETVHPKAIVLDFGGVMVKGNKAVLRDYISKLFHVEGQALENLLAEYRTARHARVPEHLFWEKKAAEYKIALPKDFEAQLENVKISSLTPMPGMRALLETYREKGVQIALLSNAGVDSSKWLRAHGYYDGFSPVLISCEIGVEKPDPKAYQIMLDALHISPEECIFVDDKEVNVQAAIALGIDAIRFKSTEQLSEQLHKKID